MYPYHDQRVQYLELGDHGQRMDLCHWIKAHPELLSVILFSDDQREHLEPGDHAQRMDLCHWIKAHSELLSVILFSDEASFTRDGVNNL